MPAAVITSATTANSVTSSAVRRGGASERLRTASSVWMRLTGWRASTSWTTSGMRRANADGSDAARTRSVAFNGAVWAKAR